MYEKHFVAKRYVRMAFTLAATATSFYCSYVVAHGVTQAMLH